MTGWLARQTSQFRAGVAAVAMDGFGDYKNAATSTVPDAVTVMDPFRVGPGPVAAPRAALDGRA
jgi:transposase